MPVRLRHAIRSTGMQDPSAVPDIVDDLSEFTPKGSSATFLLPGPPPSQPSKKGNCSFK
jgi:hypothetical protein